MPSFTQGFYKPQNPDKYRGDSKNIVYRSSWELTYLRRLDTDPNVLKWASEEVIVPYHNPVTGTVRRYFVDFWVQKVVDGKIVTQLIEIKPFRETIPPSPSKNKKRKTMLREVTTYATNQAKWEAANKYCQKKGWQFVILTENELGITW